ncbi:MAG: translation initiation factor IF-2 [Candidatus Nanohaloarchaea archaeon]
MPRQPILSVLGHVDSGKTTLLDRIRESRITDGEAGGITQMIGATEVPLETVENVCGDLLNQLDTELTIPGILFIDTPGHAAFSSLRKRGGSISDIAILVVDINEGIQPQTDEAIEILKDAGTPFVVALNKVDTIPGWQDGERLFSKALGKQSDRIQQQVDEKIYEIMGELHEHGITADRFDRVDNFQKKVAMVPISAMTGMGVSELLMAVSGLSQRYLSDELEVHEGIGKSTVLEVSQEKGLGTTLDVIHYDGEIKKTDKLVYGTPDGAKVTDIRAILEPRPLKEIRLDKQYSEVDEIEPASGVKLAGKNIEGAIAGAPVRTADEEHLDEAIEEVEKELQSLDFETDNEGVVVKADSLGSLEAVMREVADKEDIKVQKAEVGPVTKSDVIEVDNEDPENRAILAFNVGSTEQGDIAVQDKDINVFRSDVIYEIIENYEQWRDDLKRVQRENALNAISRPAKIRSMPDHVFRSSKPAVLGIKIVDGVLSPGSTLMTLDGDIVGTIKSIQEQNESLEKAMPGDEVAVSIDGATVGRDFEEGDQLIVNISGREYKQLKELNDLLTEGEKKVLQEIVDIKDSIDPHWKLG